MVKIQIYDYCVRGLSAAGVRDERSGGQQTPDDITPSCSAVPPPTLAQSRALDLDCVAAVRVCATPTLTSISIPTAIFIFAHGGANLPV